ncbi:hypothetical protein UFOVP228_28 [uncultured Caudovirales phage]|uniref:Uncharacterized protein n=1 Tax=uncultured Caudovirales phage TaxID=2100421 RepID=A0A6J7WQN8_9CAUD|nr:hypothetical protein UFOVP47_74 [uncultured Caudovirales phage]CAB5219128.1 hypothetical protein UFOVP228_28 [uncultured Caudovirales phage]
MSQHPISFPGLTSPNGRPAGVRAFTPVGELAARELSKSGGSLNSVANGRLIRISMGSNDWDVTAPWQGRELVGWNKRYSNWDKMITVTFYVDLSSSQAKLPTFTLSLKPPLTDEEVANAADTYMLLLNLARTE